MADKNAPADNGAQDTTEDDPFADFESSEYEGGKEVASKKPTPAAESMGDGGSDDSGSDDDGGTDDSGSDDDGGTDDSDSSRSKGKQTAQERINELTRLRREAEREAEAVRAELAELKQRAQPPKEPETEPKTADAKDEKGKGSEGPKPPSPDDFDYGELDPRYIRALAGFEARQEYQKMRQEDEAKLAEEAARRAQEEAQQKFQEQIDRGSKKHEDFYEKVIIGAEKGEWALSEHLGQLLADSEVGDDIAYHLASHPEEAAQVYRQTPLEQARYFGRMEAKFSADQSAATGENTGKTEKTRTPKAPPPVTPARGSDGKFSPSASTKDFAAFEAHANNQ